MPLSFFRRSKCRREFDTFEAAVPVKKAIVKVLQKKQNSIP